MRTQLHLSGYVLDAVNNIWVNPNYKGIAYNDGDEAETRIASIIQQTSDLSVLSVELRKFCTDWPSIYHLSSARANLMRPFQDGLKGEILEIGAGCGAITRYLGECGANVLALEGSTRRAAIARSRTRDLANVTVLAEKFDQFQLSHQFDVITLIGVLEYANLFTLAENPPLAMLTRIRSLLKPGGKLIIAIENQLGLKYFAGAPEDHLGQPMVGIEGRYRKDQPETFGRQVLSEFLEKAGFVESEYLAPFPDYKLPVSILTRAGLAHKGFDAAAFAWQCVLHDPQLPPYCNFSLELTWPEIFQNDLALELANSFLVIASTDAQSSITSQVLAYHYSTNRIPAYCKETVFVCDGTNDIQVQYRYLAPPNRNDETSNLFINFISSESDEYIFGKPLSLEFIQVITRDGWTFDDIAQYLLRYLSIIKTFIKLESAEVDFSSPYMELPGEFFDVIPRNIIIQHDGCPRIIDKEWKLTEPIEVGHLLFRSLLSLINAVSRFGQHVSHSKLTRYQFVNETLKAIGIELQECDYARYIKTEANIQERVTGLSPENFFTWHRDVALPVQSMGQALAERDLEILRLNACVEEVSSWATSLNKALAERDLEIGRLNASVEESSSRAVSLDKTLTERNQEMQGLSEKFHNTIAKRDDELARLVEKIKETSKKAVRDNTELSDQLSQKHAELMRISDWADGMRRDLERRNISLIGKAIRAVVGLKKTIRQRIAKSVFGDFVRRLRDYRRYQRKKVSFDSVRDSLVANNGRLIITFPIITWDFRWQRPQHIVTRLRNKGHSILYLAMSLAPLGRKIRSRNEAGTLLSFNQLDSNIHQIWLHSTDQLNIYTDSIEGDDLFNLVSGLDAAIAELKPKSIQYLLQFPGWWPIAESLRERHGGKVIFDCMDDHGGFSTNSADALRTEEHLIKNADLVITSSDVLEEKVRTWNPKTVQVKNGTEFEHFNAPKPNGELDHLVGRPVIGYYGAISDWFDMNIVAHCATTHPEWAFVLIGATFGADLSPIEGLENVHLLGEKKYTDLPGYLAYFDVCTIPFKIIPLTLATNPVKFYEYLSAGKPVVSVALPELLPYREHCYLAKDAADFESLLVRALDERENAEKIMARIKLAKENSWDSRADNIINALNAL